MAYNFYPPYFQNPQMQNVQQMQAQQNQQPQNTGFVSVRSEAEARSYPVAYGNSVTFKDETAPYIYTKTMGFSQLDRPTFEKFKLIKEDTPVEQPETASKPLHLWISWINLHIRSRTCVRSLRKWSIPSVDHLMRVVHPMRVVL